MIGEGRPLLRENLADTDPTYCKTPIFNLHCLKKTSPMFLAITRESINEFLLYLI